MKAFNLNLLGRFVVVLVLICFSVGTIYLINRAEAQEAEKDYTKARVGKKGSKQYQEEDAKANYYGYCTPCHGETGKGDGPLAVLRQVSVRQCLRLMASFQMMKCVVS